MIGAYEDQRPSGDPVYRGIEKALLDGKVLHVTTTSHTAQVETTVVYLHRDHLGSVGAGHGRGGSVPGRPGVRSVWGAPKSGLGGVATNGTETLL